MTIHKVSFSNENEYLYDIEQEKQLLGAIICNPGEIDQVKQLDPFDFYSERHQAICEAILSIIDAGEQVDIISLEKELRATKLLKKAGDKEYLTELATIGLDVITATIPHLVESIKEKAINRTFDERASKTRANIKEGMTVLSTYAETQETVNIVTESLASLSRDPQSIEDAILRTEDFTALEMPAKKKLLDPWLTEQSITLISAWRGTGKTWLALSILDAVSKGQPFGPWKAEASVPCLFLDGEMPQQDIEERIKELGIDSVFVYSDAYANDLGLPKANLLSETWRNSMKGILISKGIKLWVIDNLASLAGGIDENIKKDWDPINAWLLELRFAGIATIMLHHTGKKGDQRGTSAREDNLDISIILKQPFDYNTEDGCKFVIHFAKSRVRTQELKLIPDTEFQLRENETGQLIWTWGNIKTENKRKVFRLTDEGMKNTEIASQVGVTRQYVSKVQIQGKKDGYLTKEGKLSQSGFSFVNEGDSVDKNSDK